MAIQMSDKTRIYKSSVCCLACHIHGIPNGGHNGYCLNMWSEFPYFKQEKQTNKKKHQPCQPVIHPCGSSHQSVASC